MPDETALPAHRPAAPGAPRARREGPRYSTLKPERKDAVLVVFLAALRRGLQTGVLQPKRELFWKKNTDHLAIHLATTLRALAASGILTIDRSLVRCVLRHAITAHPGLVVVRGPVSYFDGKRDRRRAEILHWPSAIELLARHPVTFPAERAG